MPDQIIAEYLRFEGRERADALPPDVLVAEANHRIANNLTLIAGLVRLQVAGIARSGAPLSAEEACQALQEVGNRIEAVGRLHRLLAAGDDAGTLDLSEYLRDVADAAVSSMSARRRMALRHAAIADCQVAIRQALPVGFIVGELVTNSVKYAHPTGVAGVIDLRCRRMPRGGTLIEVADDGIGLPDGFDATRDGGLGMRLVRSLAGQLGASLDFIAEGIGLTVQLSLPTANA